MKLRLAGLIVLSAVAAGVVAATMLIVPHTPPPAASSGQTLTPEEQQIVRYLGSTPGLGGALGTDVGAMQIKADLGLSDDAFRVNMNALRSKGLATDGPSLSLGHSASLLPDGRRLVQ